MKSMFNKIKGLRQTEEPSPSTTKLEIVCKVHVF